MSMADEGLQSDDVSVETLIGLKSNQPLVKITAGPREPFFCSPQEATDLAMSLLAASASARCDFALMQFFLREGMNLKQVSMVINAIREEYKRETSATEGADHV